MSKTIPIPKENLIPQIKKELIPELTKEMKKNGVVHFQFLDLEWVEDGLIVHYDDSGKKSNKAKRK